MARAVRFCRRLCRDRGGAAAALLALSLPALVGIAAVVIDLGSMYLAERRLQGIADAAAAAAVSSDIAATGEAGVRAVIEQSGVAGITLHEFAPGRYVRDEAVAHHRRFTAHDPAANAARVHLRQEVPLFFAAVLTGRNSAMVAARATATRDDLVAFELGTRLVAMSGGLPNALLSALAGVDLGLTQQDISALVSTRIDVMEFADALRARNAGGNGSLGGSLDRPTPLPEILAAMADVADVDAALVLGRIAQLAAGNEVVTSDLVDLGPWGRGGVADARIAAEVEVYALLRSLLEASQGQSYAVSLDLALAGVSSTRVRIAGGQGFERSPWLTFDSAGDVILRTAETRIALDLQLGGPLLGALANLRLPLFVEVASAEARISDIVCDPDDGRHGVTVDARPAIGKVALADFNAAQFGDFTRPLALRPGRLVGTALLSVDGYADVALGGDLTQQIHFSPAEIDSRARKEVGTMDLAAATTRSLLHDLSLDVRTLGINLGLGLSKTQITAIVGDALTTLAPAVDGLLNQVTGLLGVKLGMAEVSVNALRCGSPMIVA